MFSWVIFYVILYRYFKKGRLLHKMENQYITARKCTYYIKKESLPLFQILSINQSINQSISQSINQSYILILNTKNNKFTTVLQKQSSIGGVLRICSKFTRKYPCWSVISIKLQSNFIEITLRHGSATVNLLHFLRTAFYKSTHGGLLLVLTL